MKFNLESIDVEIIIDVQNFNINENYLHIIERAWADGHVVAIRFPTMLHGRQNIIIKTLNNTTQLKSKDIDVTKDWCKYAKLLARGQLPIEWLQLVEDSGP